MKRSAVGLALSCLLAACGGAGDAGTPKETADQFVARANAELEKSAHENSMVSWVQLTYITPDTEALAAISSDRIRTDYSRLLGEAKAYEGQKLSPDATRSILLLKLDQDAPAPEDPKKRAEMSEIEARMATTYGTGKYCPKGPESCRNYDQLAEVMAKSRKPDELLDAWSGWHSVGASMRKDYQRFVELANEGAKTLGYKDLGELWRAGYDMPPADFEKETERL